MDFQSVAPPTNYGAPNVFQQQQGGAQSGSAPGQPGQQPQQGQPNLSAMLQKAKQLLSSGQISPDQYSQIAQQVGGAGPADVSNIAPAADTLNLGLGQ